MLDQSFHSNSCDNFENCDTTTTNSACLTTPFSVKDILNLNMTNESDYVTSNINFSSLNSVKSEYNHYDEYSGFAQPQNHHNWENGFVHSYDHFNYNYYTPIEANLKCETSSYKNLCAENNFSAPTHVQQLSNLCVPFPDRSKDDFSGLESPSKLNKLLNFFGVLWKFGIIFYY